MLFLLPFVDGWEATDYSKEFSLEPGGELTVSPEEDRGYLLLMTLTSSGDLNVDFSGFAVNPSFSLSDLVEQRRIFPDMLYLSQSEPPYTLVVSPREPLPFKRASITISNPTDSTVTGSYQVHLIEVYDPETFANAIRAFMGATVLPTKEIREFYKEEEIPYTLVELLRNLQKSIEELIAPAVIRVK